MVQISEVSEISESGISEDESPEFLLARDCFNDEAYDESIQHCKVALERIIQRTKTVGSQLHVNW